MLLRNIKMLYVCFLIIVRKTMIQRFRFVYFEKMKMTKLNFYILSVTSLTESQTALVLVSWVVQILHKKDYKVTLN